MLRNNPTAFCKLTEAAHSESRLSSSINSKLRSYCFRFYQHRSEGHLEQKSTRSRAPGSPSQSFHLFCNYFGDYTQRLLRQPWGILALRPDRNFIKAEQCQLRLLAGQHI